MPGRGPGPPGGFTLTEILVVLIVLSILATIALPKYFKTVETGKFQDAVATANLIGQANRMYALDNAGSYQVNPLNATHVLVSSKYIAAADWGNKAYDFWSCAPTSNSCGAGPPPVQCTNGSLTTTPVACAKRKAGPGGNYESWGLVVARDGGVFKFGTGTPDPMR